MANAFHPEDIKAEIRKRYRTVAAFERQLQLPARSVKDVLRGKSRPRIALAISTELGIAVHKLFPDRFTETGAHIRNYSPNGDNSKPK
jgi:lambda repressor-like predicted transcriptional regulator